MYGFYKTPSTFQVLALPYTIIENKKARYPPPNSKVCNRTAAGKSNQNKKRGHGNGVPRLSTLSTLLLSMAQK
jgi:hypothetical protein